MLYIKLNDKFLFFLLTILFLGDIIIKLNNSAVHTGVSPSGKAADSDSVISRVQILPPQPVRLTQLREPFYFILIFSEVSILINRIRPII